MLRELRELRFICGPQIRISLQAEGWSFRQEEWRTFGGQAPVGGLSRPRQELRRAKLCVC